MTDANRIGERRESLPLYATLARLRAGDGWNLVKEWRAAKEPESVRLEFKRKPHRDVPTFDEHELGLVAKPIAALANGNGGLFGFGFDTSQKHPTGDPDRLRGLSEITDVEQCKGILENRLHTLTDPPIAHLEVFALARKIKHTGVLIVHVPKSDAPPHRVIVGPADVRERYYMRTSTSTVVMPHPYLAALFGRRPEPSLRVIAKLTPGKLWLYVRNDGAGAAVLPAIVLRNPTHAAPNGVRAFGWSDGGGGTWRKCPTGREPEMLFQPETETVVYPKCTLLATSADWNQRHDTTVHVEGTVYARDAMPRQFSGDVVSPLVAPVVQEREVLLDDVTGDDE